MSVRNHEDVNRALLTQPCRGAEVCALSWTSPALRPGVGGSLGRRGLICLPSPPLAGKAPPLRGQAPGQKHQACREAQRTELSVLKQKVVSSEVFTPKDDWLHDPLTRQLKHGASPQQMTSHSSQRKCDFKVG